jgi:flagellin FlaB
MDSKKAEMGIGTLIIFIALLLVAAVAAGVLIQTSGSLQERALTTGDQAKGQISTNIRVVEVSAVDGSNGTLDYFSQIIKLSPGSDAIKIGQVLLTVNTYDETATLLYRGITGTYELNATTGYYTTRNVRVSGTVDETQNLTLTGTDLDHDGVDDFLSVDNVTNNVIYNFNTTVSVILGQCDAAGALTVGIGTQTIIEDVEQRGSVCTAEDALTADLTTNTLKIIPTLGGTGYFTVQYLQRGTNPVDGNLQTGDVVKIYYYAPRQIIEDEEIRINFIPKIGTPTLTEFITPEVISTERVYLYPN